MNNFKLLEIMGYSKLPKESAEIRIKVFVEEQGFEEEFDSDDERSMHFVGYANNKAVGTCRLITIDPDNCRYAIGRVAVLKEYRGCGIASELIKAAERYIAEAKKPEHTATVLIHSQLTAVGFYEKLGYVQTGERDFEQDCPHSMLSKKI